MPAVSFPSLLFPTVARVATNVLLDSRRALFHETQGWMAVADLHYGHELRLERERPGFEAWDMETCEETLLALIRDHAPTKLILVGDIMDGKSCATHALAFLTRLREAVPELISIKGNHDRPALRKAWNFVETHQEGRYIFTHGHRWTESRWSDVSTFTRSALGVMVPDKGRKSVQITGHEHPSMQQKNAAGERKKHPAFVQEQITPLMQRWILPAFSPWAMSHEYRSLHPRLVTWGCSAEKIWRV